MSKRDSNIALNLTDDNEPAVQHRNDAGESTDEQTTDEPTEGVTNPDGSITVYGTPPDDTGEATTENVPESPLDAEIRAFKQEVDHPEDWTDLERKAIAKHRRCPELSDEEISEQLDISQAVIRRGKRKVTLVELSEKNEIRAAFHECTPTQQIVIAADLAGAPDYTTSELAERADCQRGTINSTRRRFKPLIRRLDQVGLPNKLVPQPILDDINESDDIEQAADETNADNHSEPESIASRPAIEDVRQFVTGLREAANAERSLSDSPTAQQGTAARQATCEAILDYIETTHK